MDWTALATVVLAVVVVFGEWLRSLVFRPLLDVEIESSAKYVWSNKDWPDEPVQNAAVPSPPPSPPRPGQSVPSAGAAGQHRLYWIRFGIKNQPSWFSVAGQDIEVFVSSIKRAGAPERRDFVGFNLAYPVNAYSH
jgi:hypothetical protein